VIFKQKLKLILPSDIQTIGIVPRAEYTQEDIKRQIVFKAIGTHPRIKNAIFRFTARRYNPLSQDGRLLRADAKPLLPGLSACSAIVAEVINMYERRSASRVLLQSLFPIQSDELSETRLQPPTHVIEWAFQPYNKVAKRWQQPPTIVFLFPICLSLGRIVPDAVCINLCSRLFERIQLLTDKGTLEELIKPCDETTITWLGYLLIFAKEEFDLIKVGNR